MRTKAFASTFMKFNITITTKVKVVEMWNAKIMKPFLPTLSSTSELPLAVASIRKKTCIYQKKRQHRKRGDQIHETPTSTFLMSMPRAWDSNAFQNQAVFDFGYIQQ